MGGDIQKQMFQGLKTQKKDSREIHCNVHERERTKHAALQLFALEQIGNGPHLGCLGRRVKFGFQSVFNGIIYQTTI